MSSKKPSRQTISFDNKSVENFMVCISIDGYPRAMFPVPAHGKQSFEYAPTIFTVTVYLQCGEAYAFAEKRSFDQNTECEFTDKLVEAAKTTNMYFKLNP